MACTKKHSNALSGSAHTLTLEQKKQLRPGQEIYLQAKCGHFLRVRVNGVPKTLKKTPGVVVVPWKYGLYEYGHVNEHDIVKVQR